MYLRAAVLVPTVVAVLLAGCGAGTTGGSGNGVGSNVGPDVTATAVSGHSGHGGSGSEQATVEPTAAGAGASMPSHGVHGDATPTAGASFDREFLSGMTAHHQSAIEMAEAAADKAEHPELATLARNIIEAQQAENEQMQAWLKEWYGAEPESGGGRHSGMPGMQGEGAMGVPAEELREAKPFDRAFIDAMIPHHEGAIKDAQLAIKRAEHPELKELARNIEATQRQEIQQMRQWRKQWYGS